MATFGAEHSPCLFINEMLAPNGYLGVSMYDRDSGLEIFGLLNQQDACEIIAHLTQVFDLQDKSSDT